MKTAHFLYHSLSLDLPLAHHRTLDAKWVEESFTNFGKGINWRSYVVCDVAYNNVNNWLWSPFIDRGSANRLYIEIQFTIRDCSLFPGNALSCKETFSLLFYEFDAATREPPPWQPESYKLIGKPATKCPYWHWPIVSAMPTPTSVCVHLARPKIAISLSGRCLAAKPTDK